MSVLLVMVRVTFWVLMPEPTSPTSNVSTPTWSKRWSVFNVLPDLTVLGALSSLKWGNGPFMAARSGLAMPAALASSSTRAL